MKATSCCSLYALTAEAMKYIFERSYRSEVNGTIITLLFKSCCPDLSSLHLSVVISSSDLKPTLITMIILISDRNVLIWHTLQKAQRERISSQLPHGLRDIRFFPFRWYLIPAR